MSRIYIRLKNKTYEQIHGVEKAKEIKKKQSLKRKNKSWEEIYGKEGAKIQRLKVSKKMKGHKCYKDSKRIEKIRNALKGKSYEEHYGIESALLRRKKLSISHMGHIPWNKNKKNCFTKETIKKIFKSRKEIPSFPQIKLFSMVKNIYPYAKFEYKIETKTTWRKVDICIEEYKLGIEFDGIFFHKNLENDNKRDIELNEMGYKILHYRSYIPSEHELREDIYSMISELVFFKYKEAGKDITEKIVKNKKDKIIMKDRGDQYGK